MIHLKRFDCFMRKVSSFLEYPAYLNLSNLIKDSEYELYSMVIHEGYSLNSGHYYSYVKGFDNKWYSMNDSFVQGTNESRILKQSPYILFYRKKFKTLPVFKEISTKIERVEKTSTRSSRRNSVSQVENDKEPDIANTKESLNLNENEVAQNKNVEITTEINDSILGYSPVYIKISKNIQQLNRKKRCYLSHNRNLNIFHNSSFFNNSVDKGKIRKSSPENNLRGKSLSVNKNKDGKANEALIQRKNEIKIAKKKERDEFKKKQEEFLNQNGRQSKLNIKDKYDVEYDLGRLKKVKAKKEMTYNRGNPFQIVQHSLFRRKNNDSREY